MTYSIAQTARTMLIEERLEQEADGKTAQRDLAWYGDKNGNELARMAIRRMADATGQDGLLGSSSKRPTQNPIKLLTEAVALAEAALALELSRIEGRYVAVQTSPPDQPENWEIAKVESGRLVFSDTESGLFNRFEKVSIL